MTRKNTWKDQLWNVSLLPTVQVDGGSGPPPGPAPRGGSALNRPALLTEIDPTAPALAQAA